MVQNVSKIFPMITVPRFKSQVDCRINHNILVYIGGQIQELNCVAYENIKHLVICAFR